MLPFFLQTRFRIRFPHFFYISPSVIPFIRHLSPGQISPPSGYSPPFSALWSMLTPSANFPIYGPPTSRRCRIFDAMCSQNALLFSLNAFIEDISLNTPHPPIRPVERYCFSRSFVDSTPFFRQWVTPPLLGASKAIAPLQLIHPLIFQKSSASIRGEASPTASTGSRPVRTIGVPALLLESNLSTWHPSISPLYAFAFQNLEFSSLFF